MAPRDGSNVYHRPPGIDAVTNTTISSTAYNTNVQDVEADLNLPRPIVAGGTGASTAAGALTSLGGENYKQVVTNYASQVFVPGSFYSAASATGSPVPGHAFAGICYQTDASNMFIEARDQNDTSQPGQRWVRQMTAGVWSAWVADAGSNAVRYDTAQSLTSTQQTQARSNIYAASLDALSYSGMQINGSMDVSQELGTTGVGVTNGSKYALDGWKFACNGTMTASGAQFTGALPSSLHGLNSSLGVTFPTAQASLGATDYTFIYQYMEGYRVARLQWGGSNAQSITIAFWTAHTVPGLYSISIQNNGSTRTYITTYTQNTANTYEYKTVTIPGDTSGTWLYTNGIGLSLAFSAGSGSTFTTASTNTWQSGNFLSASGQVNAAASTSNAFRLTGVVVLPGTQAPTAAQSPLIMRPYDQELVTCKRYYTRELHIDINGYSGAASAYFGYNGVFTVQMRAVPTLGIVAGGSSSNIASAVFDTATVSGYRMLLQTPATGNFNVTGLTGYADARL